jgi:5-methyltetrahydropteroyltriglutamate--homocysteine methyltransferase
MSGAEMSGAEMSGAENARIRTPRAEHVGSLLRPKALLAAMDEIYLPGHTALLAEERGKDLTAMRAAEDAAIDVALGRQRDAGLDVVSDGEFRRMLFTNSFYDAVDGLRPNEQGVPFVNSAGESQEYAGPPIFDRRLTKVDSPPAKEAAYLAAHTDAPFKVTFPAASWFCEPQVISPGRPVPGYDSAEEARAHCLEILRELVLETIAQGTRYIQFDFPAYPLLADEVWSGRLKGMGVDLDEMLALSLEADRQILDGLPTDVHYGMHICRGNWRSRWMFTGSLEPFAEAVFALPYDTFLVEWEDTTREGDYSSLRHVPPGPVVAMGIVSSKSNEVESQDDVLRRMDEAAQHLDLGQLALAPQCGFGSAAEGNELDDETQWRKLELIGRVADRLWGGR